MNAGFRTTATLTPGMAPRLCVVLLLGQPLLPGVVAAEETAPQTGTSEATLSMLERIPFAASAAGEISLASPTGGALRQIAAECDLERTLAESIVAAAGRQNIQIVLVPRIDAAQGRVLAIEIEGAVGQLGGAMTGTKSLTLRGELRDGSTVIGSFVAREQKTSLASGTCKALTDCGRRIAGAIAKWLRNPTLKARLGSA